MVSPTRMLLQEMLSRAETALADGEYRLETQRLRVAALEQAGHPAEESGGF